MVGLDFIHCKIPLLQSDRQKRWQIEAQRVIFTLTVYGGNSGSKHDLFFSVKSEFLWNLDVMCSSSRAEFDGFSRIRCHAEEVMQSLESGVLE